MISAVNPFTTDGGKEVVIVGLIDYFVARLGVENVHYLLIGNPYDGEFPVDLRTIPPPTPIQAIRSVAIRTAIGRYSMQESFLWSRSTDTAVQRCLQEINANVQLYDTVRTAQYAGDAPGPTRVCYLDDLFSERYASMLSARIADTSIRFRPLGGFAPRVPVKLHFLAENRISQKALLAAEKRLIVRSENRAAQSFDRCLLLNQHETQLLQTRAAVPSGRVATIPPFINLQVTADRDYRGSPEFIFLGLLSRPHNDVGLRYFIRETWPHVVRRMPGAQLRVVGREPQPELRATISKYGLGAIFLEGYVPDLGALMAQSAAMVNPMRFGSGVKVKIIESLGRGLPVVSSEIGASGILAGVDNGVCLAQGADQWVDQLEHLTSPTHNSKVSAAASAHFARVYSRNAVFAAYDSVFGLG
jgi:glycosyltransferase involved in cell wall biosynthesis